MVLVHISTNIFGQVLLCKDESFYLVCKARLCHLAIKRHACVVATWLVGPNTILEPTRDVTIV
jgi:hypothetical protein